MKLAIETAAERIIAAAEELTELDGAIGDGDHGYNMKRGWQAALDQLDELAGLPPEQALQKLGMTMVGKVGGASGPLYGTLFLQAGKAWDGTLEVASVTAAVEAGVAGVKKRGKSEAGEKTMLDVWVPVLEALRDAGSPAEASRAARAAAEAGLAATKDMKATKGRAAYLGERSVGHLDPGARSSELLVGALCDLLDEGAAA
jgi:dihydroxyacetone kinase-like protein